MDVWIVGVNMGFGRGYARSWLGIYMAGGLSGCPGGVGGYVKYGFAVYLQRSGTVKFHGYLAAPVYIHHILMLNVSSLKQGGEHAEGLQLAAAMHHRQCKQPVRAQAILLWGGHHAAAVIAALHGGCYPNVFVLVFFAVHRYRGVYGLEISQQSLYGYGGVVDGLILLKFLILF